MKTKVCKTFKIGSHPRVTENSSTVCLSFFVKGEEIAIEFGTSHTKTLRYTIEKLQKIARRKKAARKNFPIKKEKEKEKLIVAVDF
jgi:hypothetical protein